jgi:heme-binding protein
MKKVLKVFLAILLVALILIQFIRPVKNSGEEIAENQIAAKHQIPVNVQQILKVSCYDCHGNTTSYPWYNNLQPVAWFLSDHIMVGKRELNFSIFSTYPAWRQYEKFKEIGDEVKEDKMPMYSYTLLHRDAILNADQKLSIRNWAANAMKKMEAQYPSDSLVEPK